MVECQLPKLKVASSILVTRSKQVEKLSWIFGDKLSACRLWLKSISLSGKAAFNFRLAGKQRFEKRKLGDKIGQLSISDFHLKSARLKTGRVLE